MTMDEHLLFLEEAIKEAELAAAIGEVPIGAVVVCNGEIVGRGHNLRERDNDPTAHAEICALRDAGKNLGTWRLENCTLYVTMEPCPMCCGALINSRVHTVVFGASEPKFGSAGSQLNLLQFPGFNHNVHIVGPIAQERCSQMMKDFFAELRRKK
ncbi:MAG: tRNA adenosine(34) deaminase TadA [Peptococcaceae bacterium]|jgi:tRNA(adenine34) deaminase|nr:tRNA adenosine(34) deaminase TadA [Peptococcaceae bacterium]MBQ5858785.1 tRNA adenosine(34) deaminase TadA [Peptococcaceae bacterium]